MRNIEVEPEDFRVKGESDAQSMLSNDSANIRRLSMSESGISSRGPACSSGSDHNGSSHKDGDYTDSQYEKEAESSKELDSKHVDRKGSTSLRHTTHSGEGIESETPYGGTCVHRKSRKRVAGIISPDSDADSSMAKVGTHSSAKVTKKESSGGNESHGTVLNTVGTPKSRILGAYIPPAKLKHMQEQITDKGSEEYQRFSWEALRKSINGHVNKVNVSNIKNIVIELFKENVLRGKGLYCRCIVKAQAASPSFTAVYAALTAIINTKFPQVGILLLKRLLSQFKRGYRRGDKNVCLATARFLAHCVNQRLVHEILALQLIMLLLESPTDASIEVSVAFIRDCGAFLSENSPKAVNTIFDRFRDILHECNVEKRTQYMIEVLFQVRRDKFKDNPAIPPGLDLIEEDDQLVHMITIDDEDLDPEEDCNVFRFDPNFLENEEKYKKISKEILGDDEDEESDRDSDNDEDDEDDEEGDQGSTRLTQIQDETDINNMNFRRAIYLTIMSSFSFEECAHKLMKLDMKPGQEQAFASMMIECCSVERTYISMYGLVTERFCKLNRTWMAVFTQEFERAYKTIHRYEINLLRNIAKFFAHLLSTDAISWEVFVLVRLTEADTTSSLRIFLKIILQDLSEFLGIKQLLTRMKNPELVVRVSTDSGTVVRHVFEGMFPKDNPRNTRFAINYFTSIGLDALTDDLREYLKNAPKLIMAQKQEAESDDESASEASSNSTYCSTCSSSHCSTCSSSYCSTCGPSYCSTCSPISKPRSSSRSPSLSSAILSSVSRSTSYSSSLISSLHRSHSGSVLSVHTSTSPLSDMPSSHARTRNRRTGSPIRRRDSQNRRRVSPSRHRYLPDKRLISPDRRRYSSDKCRRSPDGHRHTSDGRRRSLDKRQYSSGRSRISPDKRQYSPVRRRRSPGNRQYSPMRRRRSPDEYQHSPDKRRKLSGTYQNSLKDDRRLQDTRQDSPKRYQRSPYKHKVLPKA